MEQNEHDIQRFLQIREEIHEEIKKIDPSVASFQEVIKRLKSHFEVFQNLSQKAQEQIKSAIKEASYEMTEGVAEEVSQKIEDHVQETLTALDQSVQAARSVLDETREAKYRKLVLLFCVGWVLCGLGGAGAGYFYAKQHTYALPRDFIRLYALGLSVQDASSKINPQEKQKMKNRSSKKRE